MSQLHLQLADQRTTYSPGETLRGTASWQLDEPPKKAELCLAWSTRGKGSEDLAIVTAVPFDSPQATDSRPFSIQLPPSPYTFSGQLISLLWTLELNINPGELTESCEIVVAPGGLEVLLPRIQPA